MAVTMLINGVPYVERKPRDPVHPHLGACIQCAFFRDTVGCQMAVCEKAREAFGGDCEQRDVVYMYAEGRGA